MTTTNELISYARTHGFGDYTRAPYETREEIADMTAAYIVAEEARHNSSEAIERRTAEARRAASDAYYAGEANAAQVRLLFQSGHISEEEARGYYAAKGWAYPKYGLRK